MTEPDPAMERAKKYVAEVRDFYYHLMTYVLVNALLVIIDLRSDTSEGFLGLDFAYWIILGWGFGLIGHAISVFFGDYRAERLYEKEKSREIR